MKYPRSLSILGVGLLAPLLAPARAPTPAPLSASEAATLDRNVIITTIISLRVRPRVAARIEEEVDMLNQKFSLEGGYYKDTGHRLRLQLGLKGLDETGSTMLQVCDGKVLWEYQNILDMKNYRCRRITTILERLEDPMLGDHFRAQVATSLGFGGPEGLLVGFLDKVAFDQFAVEMIDDVETYVMGGTWNDRSGLTGAGNRPLSPTAPLPHYIPSKIKLFVAKATLWPYKIEMLGGPPDMIPEGTREVGPDGRPIGQQRKPPKVDPSRIVLKYTLLPESAIEPEKHFHFDIPRDAGNVFDDTAKFLAELETVIQIEVNRKKAEAAKEESDQPPLKASPLEVINRDIDTTGDARDSSTPR